MKLIGEQEQHRVLAHATITPGRETGCLYAVVGYAVTQRKAAGDRGTTCPLGIRPSIPGGAEPISGTGLERRGSQGFALPPPDQSHDLSIFRTESLATLKLHYDGWLALPAGLRRTLDLKTGDRLVAELVEGAIVLRPAKGTRAPTDPEAAIESCRRLGSGTFGRGGLAAAAAAWPAEEGADPRAPSRTHAGDRGRSPAPAQAQAGTAAEGPRRSGRARRRARAFVRGGRGRAVEAAAESGAAGSEP